MGDSYTPGNRTPYAQVSRNVPAQESSPGCVSPLARGLCELLSGQAQLTRSSRDTAGSWPGLGSALQHACNSSDLSLPGWICSPWPTLAFPWPPAGTGPSASAENCCTSWEIKAVTDGRGCWRLGSSLKGTALPAWTAVLPSRTDHPFSISFSGGWLSKPYCYILKQA